jgi:hypothetical protein
MDPSIPLNGFLSFAVQRLAQSRFLNPTTTEQTQYNLLIETMNKILASSRERPILLVPEKGPTPVMKRLHDVVCHSKNDYDDKADLLAYLSWIDCIMREEESIRKIMRQEKS